MNAQYLTLKRFIQGTINTLIDYLVHEHPDDPQQIISGYRYIGKTTAPNMRASSRVGMYTKAKQKYFIKQYRFVRANLDYVYLANEIRMLQLLNTIESKNARVHTPILNSSTSENKYLRIITDYEIGETLMKLSSKRISDILYSVITHIQKVSALIPKEARKQIGYRSPLITLCTFPWYAVRSCIAEPNRLALIVRLIGIFYKHSSRLLIGNQELGLIHRDLNMSNILYNKNTDRIVYTDLECMVIGDELYDIALVPRMYARHMQNRDLFALLNRLNLTVTQKHRLIPLMISACFIKIATSEKSEPGYKNAIAALTALTDHIIPRLIQKKNNSLIHTFAYRLKRDITLIIENPIDFIQTCFDPNDTFISVKPYNPKLTKMGNDLVKKIQKTSPQMPVLFVGSAALKICEISSDIDLLVACDTKMERQEYTKTLTTLFGKPVIDNPRFSKWAIKTKGPKAEVILGYRTGRMISMLLQAYELLSKNILALHAYDELKKISNGSTFREYQKNKLYFFHNALSRKLYI